MKIRAKLTLWASKEPVTIIGFVSRYNETYAVIVNSNKTVSSVPLCELEIIDEDYIPKETQLCQ